MKGALLFAIGCFFLGVSVAQDCATIKVNGVIDGDTLKAEVPALPDHLRKVSIRIIRIDTPEIHGKCEEEKKRARQAKEFLTEKFKETHLVTFGWMEWDKYGGRILAEVFFDGVDVGKMMVDAGYAASYFGEKKVNLWCGSTGD